MIQIDSLKKVYGNTTVLDIPNLRIPKGQCFGLVGNNGAGKTTLFRIILDLVRATEGAVLVDGENVSQGEQWKTKIGAYLDENMLLSYLSPEEYFATLKKIYGLSEAELQLHLDKFTDLFNGEILGSNKYIRGPLQGQYQKSRYRCRSFGTTGSRTPGRTLRKSGSQLSNSAEKAHAERKNGPPGYLCDLQPRPEPRDRTL